MLSRFDKHWQRMRRAHLLLVAHSELISEALRLHVLSALVIIGHHSRLVAPRVSLSGVDSKAIETAFFSGPRYDGRVH